MSLYCNFLGQATPQSLDDPDLWRRWWWSHLSPTSSGVMCRTCVALQVAAETSYLQLWVRIMLCDRRAEEGEADSAQGAKKEQAQDTLELDPSAITSTNGGTHTQTHAHICTHQSTCERKGRVKGGSVQPGESGNRGAGCEGLDSS